MLIYTQGLFIGALLLLLFGCYGQVAPLYPAQSDLTSGSLVAAGSIGIVVLAASAAMAVRAEQKNINCEQNIRTLEQSFNDLSKGKEEAEKQLKEANEEIQLFKATCTCTTSGYLRHPVLGCIKWAHSPTSLTSEQWAAKCAEDGAKLIVVNSATENEALYEFMICNDVVIQGSRVSDSSPWMTDDGQPLPFLGEFLRGDPKAGELRLVISFGQKWDSVSPSARFVDAVCEISV